MNFKLREPSGSPRRRVSALVNNVVGRNKRRAIQRAISLRQEDQFTGEFGFADRSPSGRRTGVVIGTTGFKGGLSRNPGDHLAWRIRNALAVRRPEESHGPCRVYDPTTGQLVSLIDPATRQRIPVKTETTP